MKPSIRVGSLVISTVVLVCISGCTSSGDSPATSSPTETAAGSVSTPTSFETHPPLTGSAASSLAADLGSGDQSKVTAQLVLPTDGTTIDPTVYGQLQALGPIVVDDSSFKQLSDTLAQTYAKVGQSQQDWTFVLTWNGSRWQLADTLEGRQDLSQQEPAVESPEVSATT